MPPTTNKSPPESRDDIHFAIFCARVTESTKVNSILDPQWDEDYLDLGKASGDPNVYQYGCIGRHNVVLICLGMIGGYSAMQVAIHAKQSFINIRYAFLVGYCGAVPSYGNGGKQIFLGDCIVSTEVIQYDFVRQYPDVVEKRASVEDILPRSGLSIRTLIASLQTDMLTLETKLRNYLAELEDKDKEAKYPGFKEDILFPGSFRHSHSPGETCDKCFKDVGICGQDCEKLGCKKRWAKQPELIDSDLYRRGTDSPPRCHFGKFATANTVMKSGDHRDHLARKDGIIACEMEARGFWEIFPTIVVKAVCDYADSHKSKDWQPYAACVAACALKAILAKIPREDRPTPARRITLPIEGKSASIMPSPVQPRRFDTMSTVVEDSSIEWTDTHSRQAIMDSPNEPIDSFTGPIGRFDTSSSPQRQLFHARTIRPSSEVVNKLIQELKGKAGLLQDGQTYWSHMTMKGFKMYEKLLDSVQHTNSKISIIQFAEALGDHLPKPDDTIKIWKRFVPDVSQALPRPYISALLYMLHMEHFQLKYIENLPEMNNDLLTDDLLIILLAFHEWVDCSCREKKCKLSWNFVGTNWGWYKGDPPKKEYGCLVYKRYLIKELHRNDPPGTPYNNPLPKDKRDKSKILQKICWEEWVKKGQRNK